ncbi:MAG: hypothetical protein AAFN93_21660 [Bacteroidota bacterium]
MELVNPNIKLLRVTEEDQVSYYLQVVTYLDRTDYVAVYHNELQFEENGENSYNLTLEVGPSNVLSLECSTPVVHLVSLAPLQLQPASGFSIFTSITEGAKVIGSAPVMEENAEEVMKPIGASA